MLIKSLIKRDVETQERSSKLNGETFESFAKKIDESERAAGPVSNPDWYSYPQTIVFLCLCTICMSLLAVLTAKKVKEKHKPKRHRAESFIGDDESNHQPKGNSYGPFPMFISAYFSSTNKSVSSSSSTSISSSTVSKLGNIRSVRISDRKRLRAFFMKSGLPPPRHFNDHRAKKIISILELSSILEADENQSKSEQETTSRTTYCPQSEEKITIDVIGETTHHVNEISESEENRKLDKSSDSKSNSSQKNCPSNAKEQVKSVDDAEDKFDQFDTISLTYSDVILN